MSVQEVAPSNRNATLRRSIRRTVLTVLATAALLNLLIWAAARLAGVELEVGRSGAELMSVGPVMVVLTTAVAVLVGGLALYVSALRWSRPHAVLGWVGLAIGVLTVVLPLTAVASAGTRGALAVMHIATGVVWWLGLQRSGR